MRNMCRVRSQHEPRLRWARAGLVPTGHVQVGTAGARLWGGLDGQGQRASEEDRSRPGPSAVLSRECGFHSPTAGSIKGS